MPSIIEVDTIKNKTGTQNTVLSTDGSGNNTLNANTIKDGSATKTLATLSSSAVTLHSDVNFPAGHVVQTQRYVSSEQTNITSNNFLTTKTAGSFAFTPRFASSNILLFVQSTCWSNATGGYIFLDLYKNASDVTETANLSGNVQGICIMHHSATWQTKTFFWLDECSENSTTPKTYKISGRLSTNGSGYIGWGSNSPSVVVIQEIAT